MPPQEHKVAFEPEPYAPVSVESFTASDHGTSSTNAAGMPLHPITQSEEGLIRLTNPEYAAFLAWKAVGSPAGTVNPGVGFVSGEAASARPLPRTAREVIAAGIGGMASSEDRFAFSKEFSKLTTQANQIAIVHPEPYAPVSAESMPHTLPAAPSAITQGMPVVRPESYVSVSVESLSAIPRNPVSQAPIPPDAIALEGDAHLEPMIDPAQRLAELPPDVIAPFREVDSLNAPTESRIGEALGKIGEELRSAGIDPDEAEVVIEAEDVSDSLSAEDKKEAIKADIRAGMTHKLLMATHHVNAVSLKALKAEVAAEQEPVEA